MAPVTALTAFARNSFFPAWVGTQFYRNVLITVRAMVDRRSPTASVPEFAANKGALDPPAVTAVFEVPWIPQSEAEHKEPGRARQDQPAAPFSGC